MRHPGFVDLAQQSVACQSWNSHEAWIETLCAIAKPRATNRKAVDGPMNLLERYIFRTAATSFALCLGALTGVIWITSAIKEMDLVSGKGQTLLVFFQVTLLTLPALVMIIAPIALFAAILYTLNKLNSDSELIVMNAAGMAPIKVAKPLGLLTLLVALMVGYITIFAMPESFRNLRDMLTKIRADVVTKFLQEGRFTTIDKGITFHYREKSPSGAMQGILIHDARDITKQTTYLAERGQIVENNKQAYIILENGSVHRQQDASRDNAIVAYDRYAIDLDQFGADDGKTVYKPRERTTFDLLNVDTNDQYARLQAGRFRAELHERFANPFYPLACMMIGFAALGGAKTTRQGRGSAIAAAVIAMVALRIAGFGASSLAVRSASFVPLIYFVPLGTSFLAAFICWRSMAVAAHTPAFVTASVEFAESLIARGRRMIAR
jgi:lipopolysaccharide export system permease protein